MYKSKDSRDGGNVKLMYAFLGADVVWYTVKWKRRG